jgi:hypothetical protein
VIFLHLDARNIHFNVNNVGVNAATAHSRSLIKHRGTLGTQGNKGGWEIPAGIMPTAKPAGSNRRYPVTVMERD